MTCLRKHRTWEAENRLAGKSSASHPEAPADGAAEGPETLGQENQAPSSSFLPSSIKALGLCKCSGMSTRPQILWPRVSTKARLVRWVVTLGSQAGTSLLQSVFSLL